jgi:putative nucleotidyltransferase with HDIG domain
MDRVGQIMTNPLYKDTMEKIRNCEKGRIFCLHGLQHCLDVARIAFIINLEEEMHIRKDLIYGAALLHDIGRASEYRDGIPHEEAGYMLAQEILKLTDYDPQEQQEILKAVHDHRGMPEAQIPGTLSGLIKKADKLSRLCFDCQAEEECFWPDSKKNKTILV